MLRSETTPAEESNQCYWRWNFGNGSARGVAALTVWMLF